MTNALAFRPFHKLTVYQRVWIVKSLCDHCAVCMHCALLMTVILGLDLQNPGPIYKKSSFYIYYMQTFL